MQPEDAEFIIRDTNTGQVYDIRNQSSTLMLSQVDEQLTKLPEKEQGKPWEEWWNNKRKNNNLFLTAAEKGDKANILNLLDKKIHGDLTADIDVKGLDDFTPLHLAVAESKTDVIDILLDNGASIEAVTSFLRTPLHLACFRGSREVIEILVKRGAKINVQEKDGNTPTHILSESGWIDSLSWLLAQGPDLTIKNIYNETAIEVAATYEVTQEFARYVKPERKKDTYSRTIMENIMFHNNRIDTVKSYLFKQQLAQQMSAPAPSPAPPSVPVPAVSPKKSDQKQQESANNNKKETKPDIPKRRLIKIIEATKKLRNLEAEQKDKQNHEIGPEDFDPLHVLGKGSFGEVYLVKYKANGKEYAMKVLNKKRVLGQNLVKYARTERNVLCYTKHPFIVGLDFAFQNATKLFMIMEYCPG